MTDIPYHTGFRARIVDTQTGEARWHEADYPWSRFVWTEGNFSCDCNRGLFFAAAKGEDDPDAPCDGDRYRVPYVELLPGGELIDVDYEVVELGPEDA